MTGVDVEFKALEGGRLWPPVIGNGVVSGYAQVGSDRRVDLFEVTAAGLFAQGIHYLWTDLSSISITEGYVLLRSEKYPSGGLRLVLDGLRIEGPNGAEIKQLDGYPVSYCLLNRITYEQQKLVDPS